MSAVDSAGISLRLGIVADVHHGDDIKTKLGSRAVPLLEDFLSQCRRQQVDFIVDLGDRINNPAFRGPGGDPDRDRSLMEEVGRMFGETPIPRHHVTGNHDILYLDREAIGEALGQPVGSRHLRSGGVDLILWDACVEPIDGAVRLTDADLAWLQATLSTVSRPAVICTHIPLDNGGMVGNHYFEHQYRRYATYENGDRARTLIEDSGKVVLCLAGHTHWFALNVIRRVPYLTVPSLTESCDTGGRAEGAFAIVEVRPRMRVVLHGLRNLSLSWPLSSGP